jgi:3-phenylpropionate/cinnamic acid dioxygenase small subunit
MQLIDDASKSKIEDRILIVRKYWSGNFNEYVQRHILSLPVVAGVEGDAVRMEQNFAVYATDTNFGGSTGGRSSLLCVGRYLASFAGTGGGRRLITLHAILDTSLITQSLVYPI